MLEAKRPLKVFLCHAHSDAAAVRSLYRRLTTDGVDAWLDKEKLLPGQDWDMEIRKEVREADTVVVCLSKQFNQAGFRQKEVRLALDAAMEKPEGKIFIIPARLEECDNLESLRKWEWVDLFEEAGYKRLMLAFNEKSKRIGAMFELREQHSAFTSSDTSFIKKVVEELEKQEREKPALQISIVQRFSAPGSKEEGIAWDGSSIWLSDNSGVIFKVGPLGNVLDSVRSPEVTPQGITWDGASFWVFTTNHFLIHQFQIIGGNTQTVSSFRSPASVAGGGITQDMAWDGENLWYANQFKVYNMDTSGKVLHSFTFPKNVTGLAWEGSNIWLACNDFSGNAMLTEANTDGEIVETCPSPVFQINGLAWADGYL
jgi:hypothetical protein